MKVTMSLMRVLDDTMNRVSVSKWKRGKTVLMVERFKQRVADAMKPFTQAHQKLLRAYVEPDEEGNLTVPPEHEKYKEVMEEFSKMVRETIDFEMVCLFEEEDIRTSDSVEITADDIAFLRSLGLMAETIEAGERKIRERVKEQKEAMAKAEKSPKKTTRSKSGKPKKAIA